MTRTGAADAAVADACNRVSACVDELNGLLAACSSVSADAIRSVESAGRRMDAARILVVAPLADNFTGAEAMGYANPIAAVATLAQIGEKTARARLAVASGIVPAVSLTGGLLPPAHQLLRDALVAGRVGFDSAILITKELDGVAHRAPAETLAAAESVMVNLAAGLDPTGVYEVLPVSVDYLAAEMRQIASAIDPDGALPREERAARRRSVSIGREDEDGLVYLSGRILPEVAGQLRGLLEAWRRSPRFAAAAAVATGTSDTAGGAGTGGVGDHGFAAEDSRTPGQRRHDALAEVLIAAAASAGAPQLDGHPVTVLVTVTADDLQQPDALDSDPIGTMTGSSFPVSRKHLERFIDAGGYRTVTLSPAGRITGISSPQRCFVANQRLAIIARDGDRCSTPGCTSPHIALQVHHVIPWRDGGPTTTDNGILLCYEHHRTVDDGPWQYRIIDGLPEVRGPGMPEWTRLRPRTARAA